MVLPMRTKLHYQEVEGWQCQSLKKTKNNELTGWDSKKKNISRQFCLMQRVKKPLLWHCYNWLKSKDLTESVFLNQISNIMHHSLLCYNIGNITFICGNYDIISWSLMYCTYSVLIITC